MVHPLDLSANPKLGHPNPIGYAFVKLQYSNDDEWSYRDDDSLVVARE